MTEARKKWIREQARFRGIFDKDVYPEGMFGKRISLSSSAVYGEEKAFIEQALEEGPGGGQVGLFERELAEYMGLKYAVALSSGQAALHLALRLAGERLYGSSAGILTPAGTGRGGCLQGKRVFCSDLTTADLVTPIVYEGGELVFLDSADGSDWSMDPEVLELAFGKYPDVKIVVMNHVYGFPGQAARIRQLCREHGALVIECAGEALGAEYQVDAGAGCRTGAEQAAAWEAPGGSAGRRTGAEQAAAWEASGGSAGRRTGAKQAAAWEASGGSAGRWAGAGQAAAWEASGGSAGCRTGAEQSTAEKTSGSKYQADQVGTADLACLGEKECRNGTWAKAGTLGDYCVLDFGRERMLGRSGGALLTGDSYAAEKARYWASGARAGTLWNQHEELGCTCQMDELVAAGLRGQLLHLDELIIKKKKIYDRYLEKLDGAMACIIPVPEGTRPSCCITAMTCESNIQFMETRDDRKYTYEDIHGTAAPMEIWEALEAFNVESRPVYKPMSMQPVFRNQEHFTLDGPWRMYENFRNDTFWLRCDMARQYYESGICLPGDVGMTEEEQDRVLEIICACYDRAEIDRMRWKCH